LLIQYQRRGTSSVIPLGERGERLTEGNKREKRTEKEGRSPGFWPGLTKIGTSVSLRGGERERNVENRVRRGLQNTVRS